MKETNDMKLTHATVGISRAISILKIGIVRPKDLDLKKNFTCSDDRHIYLSALTKVHIIRGESWGRFQFVLNDCYVKANKKQFRVHAKENECKRWEASIYDKTIKKFHKFVEKVGFKEHRGGDLKVQYQIISSKSINLEGLEALVIPYSIFLEKEESKIIRALPKHMKLYAHNYDKMARIK